MIRWLTKILFALVLGHFALPLTLDPSREAWAAVTVDACTVYTEDSSDATITFSHTIGGGCTNCLLLVGIETDSDPDDISAVAWNTSETLTLKLNLDSGASNEAWLYYRIAPTTGTHNIDVTSINSNPTAMGIVACSFSGVDQATPLGTEATNTNNAGSASTGSSVAIGLGAGRLGFDFVSLSDPLTGATVGADQVQRANELGGGWMLSSTCSLSPCDWTWESIFVGMAHIAVPINAAAGASPRRPVAPMIQ